MIFEWILFHILSLAKSPNIKHPFKKKCIYTILINNYDVLNEPRYVTNQWDYICLTDNPKLTSKTWTIIHVKNTQHLDPVRFSRQHKCFSEIINSSYDVSIYIDANIIIKNNLDHFLNISFKDNHDISILYHPYHISLKQEVDACKNRNLDKTDLIDAQYKHYVEQENYIDTLLHVNNRLIIRKSNLPRVQKLCQNWFEQICTWSYRDQLSFNPTLSKHPDVKMGYIEYWKFNHFFQKIDHL